MTTDHSPVNRRILLAAHPQGLPAAQDEHVVEGLQNAPEALHGLLQGRHLGKLVIRVSDD